MKILGLMTLAVLSTSALADGNKNGTIKIYDAFLVPQIVSMFESGRLVYENGKKAKKFLIPPTAKILNKNLEATRDYFANQFSRKSWDNKGADIKASIRVNRLTVIDILGTKQNAAWTGDRFIFGAGDNKGLDNFEKALDVVGHEYTHAIIEKTSNLKYEGQSGALNEHLADVFGVIINNLTNPGLANPYLLGASVLNGPYAEKAEALRDMMDPTKSLVEDKEHGFIGQPDHMDDLKTPAFEKYGDDCVPSMSNDTCGVHILSGIPNKMAALVMSKMGFKKSGPLFYNVMTKRLSKDSNFADYRAALMEECAEMSADTCKIVDDALKTVGI